MANQRNHRIGDQIQKEISSLLARGVKDPRIGFVTITGVEVTADLHVARVYYTVMGDSDTRAQCEKGLEKAKPFIRGQIGRRIRLRFTPDIRFVYDSTLDHSDYINRLLREAGCESSHAKQDPDTD